MAETTEPAEQQVTKPNATGMVVEGVEPAAAPDSRSMQKQRRRPREEGEDDHPQGDVVPFKKRKVENENDNEKKKNNKKKKSEERAANKEQEKGEQQEEEEEAEKKPSGPIKLGYKTFDSSLEIFDYFYNFLHIWPLDLNVNKYEHAMLLELVKSGGYDVNLRGGIRAFQVRNHPIWLTRWFFIIRKDEYAEAFSFRKCVERIRPLPEEMQPNPIANHALRGKPSGGGGCGGKEGGGKDSSKDGGSKEGGGKEGGKDGGPTHKGKGN